MRRKTIIIGMCNPYSLEPSHALYPLPENSAGWRLWKLLHDRTGATKMEYSKGFERMNLVAAREWDARRGRKAAELLIEDDLLLNRRVILLGTPVRAAFRLPPVLVRPVESRGVVFRQIPHPIGRSRWYNDPKHRAVVGMLLEEELRR